MREHSEVAFIAHAHAEALQRAQFHADQGRADLAGKFEKLADSLARALSEALENHQQVA